MENKTRKYIITFTFRAYVTSSICYRTGKSKLTLHAKDIVEAVNEVIEFARMMSASDLKDNGIPVPDKFIETELDRIERIIIS